MTLVVMACIAASATAAHDSSSSSSSDVSDSTSSDRYTVASGSVQDIEASTSHQTVMKTWSVETSKDEEIDGIKLELPGRAFISYVSGESSGPLAYVNVSGDSEELIKKVSVESSGDKTLWVGIGDDRSGLTGHLLTEVFLLQSSKVKAVVSVYSAEVVVEGDVLATAGDSSAVALTVSEQSNVYLSAASEDMSVTAMHVQVKNTASLQIDVANVAVSEEADFGAHVSGSITLFASTFSSKYLTLEADNNGQICFNSDDVDVDHLEGHDSSKISFPKASKSFSGVTGDFACAQKSVPAREPSSVSNSSDSSSTSMDATGSSSSLVASTSSDSASPTTTEVSAGTKLSGSHAEIAALLLLLAISGTTETW
ncbi:hypothetical protein BBJ28_00012298 [Nothophytophthora sp. Chile5]|nr:hypothetical protein BBJ28_00012298 [Nothophytophthora sp. Chile5]